MCGSLRLSLESTTLMGISTRPAAGKIGSIKNIGVGSISIKSEPLEF